MNTVQAAEFQQALAPFFFREYASLVLFLRARPRAFHPPLSRVSHAESSKDKQEYAPTQTGIVICCSRQPVDFECRPSSTKWLSERAKKL
jgi:hypothetical protein